MKSSNTARKRGRPRAVDKAKSESGSHKYRLYDWPNHQFLTEHAVPMNEAKIEFARVNRKGVSIVPMRDNGRQMALSGEEFSRLFDLHVHNGVPVNGTSLLVSATDIEMEEDDIEEAERDAEEASKL